MPCASSLRATMSVSISGAAPPCLNGPPQLVLVSSRPSGSGFSFGWFSLRTHRRAEQCDGPRIPGLEGMVDQCCRSGGSAQLARGPLVWVCCSYSVDDQAFCFAVELGAAGEQCDVVYTEIEQDGLNRARHRSSGHLAVCFGRLLPGRISDVGVVFSLPGDGRPREREGSARRMGHRCYSPEGVCCPAAGPGGLRVALEERHHSFPWRSGERVRDVVVIRQ